MKAVKKFLMRLDPSGELWAIHQMRRSFGRGYADRIFWARAFRVSKAKSRRN